MLKINRLSIHLLGSFRVTLDGRPVTKFESDRVRALLAYLAVEAERPQRREKLVGLIWPDWPERSARKNLSQALYNLRAAIGDREAELPFLLISPKTIQFNRESSHALDVVKLTTLEDVTPLESVEKALAAYGGHFLADFSLPDSVPFEEWATTTREELRRKALEACVRLASHYEAAVEKEQAISYARQAVALDPCSEEVQGQLIRLLALSGDRGAALAQYEECRATLWRELGVDPTAETQTLFRAVQTGELGGDGAKEETHAPGRRQINLPQQLTPFVGREEELTRIRERLADPDCRLLTLVGPGGSGKTRLAIEAAAGHGQKLEHGTAFVSLAPLKSVEAVVPTVSEALGFSFHSEGGMGRRSEVEPQVQLLDYLQQKRLLLVMDNYEHLLAPASGGGTDGATLVSEILKHAPGVKILATSRTRLNVGGEQRFPVSGMAYPGAAASAPDPGILRDTVTYSAVQLFMQCARRAVPGFKLTTENVAGVVAVCRLVEGMPLAIRLAAAWVEMLSPAEIAAEIGQGLDLLETEVQDVPGRQRSMRAVLDHSWRTLTERERSLMGALSIFRGGFTREAAEAVTGASLRDLMGLVNKSLLYRGAPSPAPSTKLRTRGRYEIHELTRQYAAERLDALPESWERANDEHSAYYAAALERWGADLKSARHTAALEEMDLEIENARAAWDWAAEWGKVDRLDQALEGLRLYYAYRYRYQELKSAYKTATDKLTCSTAGDELRVLSRILTWQGYDLLDDLDRQMMERAMALLEGPDLAEQDTRRERASALRSIAWATRNIDCAKARGLLEQSLALYREAGEQWWTACLLLDLCVVAQDLGAFDEARQLGQEGLSIFQVLGDPEKTAESYQVLSVAAFRQGRLEEAEDWARQCLAIVRGLGDRGVVTRGLSVLGLALCGLGKFSEAYSLLEETVATQQDLGIPPEGPWQVFLGWSAVHLGWYEHARSAGQTWLTHYGDAGDQYGLGLSLFLLSCPALAGGAYEDAKHFLRESVAIFRAIGMPDELGYTLAALALATRGQGDMHRVGEFLLEALQLAAETGAFLTLMHVLPAMALLLADRGERGRAVELYALASRYPFVAKSRWFEDVVGAQIAAVAAALPPEVVPAAEARGRARDLNATIAELLVELGDGPAEEE